MRVRLTPKSSVEGVDGVAPSAEGAALAARVRAVPAEGEANAAVEELIARWLDVPKSTVRVTAGAKSRIKSLTISGETNCLRAAAPGQARACLKGGRQRRDPREDVSQ